MKTAIIGRTEILYKTTELLVNLILRILKWNL